MTQQAAQVYFPKSTYFAIKWLAQKENKPLAAWIRDLAVRELKKELKQRKSVTELQSYCCPDMDPTLSQSVDEIVYGLQDSCENKSL